MVQDTGKTPGAGAIKPVDTPASVRVEQGRGEQPVRIYLRDWRRVTAIQDRWRIDDEWWRERPISRMYYRVLLEDGRETTVFQDLVTPGWYKQSYG